MHPDASGDPSDILRKLSYENIVNSDILSESPLAFFSQIGYTIPSFKPQSLEEKPGLSKYGLEDNKMKTFNTVMKVLAALAAVAGVIYVVAAFGDKIVAWAKRVVGCCPWDEGMEEETAPEAPAEEPTPAEETAAPEAPAEAPAEEAAPAAQDNAPVASEEDFEG